MYIFVLTSFDTFFLCYSYLFFQFLFLILPQFHLPYVFLWTFYFFLFSFLLRPLLFLFLFGISFRLLRYTTPFFEHFFLLLFQPSHYFLLWSIISLLTNYVLMLQEQNPTNHVQPLWFRSPLVNFSEFWQRKTFSPRGFYFAMENLVQDRHFWFGKTTWIDRGCCLPTDLGNQSLHSINIALIYCLVPGQHTNEILVFTLFMPTKA